MYIISTRKKITSGIDFSDSDYLLKFENGFLQSCSDTSFTTRLRNKKLLILVHGFNNPFEDVIQEYQLIANQKESHFPEEYDHIVGFLWPGGESELDYFHAKKMAEETGPRLSRWLSLFSNADCEIDIIGHSMAAVVGFNALNTEDPISIRNVFSFGAAISKDTLLREDTLLKMTKKVSNLYIFHTRNDGILKYGYRLLEWREALGFSGPPAQARWVEDLTKMRVIDCSEVIRDHLEYRQSDRIFRFIANILKGKRVKQFYRLKPDIHKVYNEVLKPVFN